MARRLSIHGPGAGCLFLKDLQPLRGIAGVCMSTSLLRQVGNPCGVSSTGLHVAFAIDFISPVGQTQHIVLVILDMVTKARCAGGGKVTKRGKVRESHKWGVL
jgi:hypothetical protein